jgi:serine/threonine protein kinase
MIGQTISHYRIVGKLGEGGMGVVYKAEDTRLDRTVALKFLSSHLVTDEDGRRRFIREAKAAASLDHPNICTVYEIDEADGKVFIAMACIEGRSLTDAIAGGPMKLPEALDIARQVARGLQEAHSKGIVHRDIKPPNVMVSTTGSGERLVKIMDFGLAQLTGVTKLTRADTTLGTIAYMSPEQTQGTTVDHRADIWSLGVVLYEMLTAQQAFKGHYEQAVMYSILNEEPEPVTTLRSGVPMELEWILGKALAKEADRRYQSALEFAVDLDAVALRLQTSGSTMARSVVRGVAPPMPRTESNISTPGHTAAASGEILSQQRRRRTRDALLELGSQGLLPDRVLSQALDLLGRPPEQTTPAGKRRNELLEALINRQIRVGEFIEHWQQVEVPTAPSLATAPMAVDFPEEHGAEEHAVIEHAAQEQQPVEPPPRGWRTQTEFFGWPLVHCVRGVDPRTGKRLVARGVVAIGEIAVGLIACGGVALGGLSLGIVSGGLLAAGVCALGLAMSAGLVAAGSSPFGLVTLPMLGDTFFGGIFRIIALVFLIRLLIRRKRFRKQFGDDGGAVSVWAILGAREWRSDGTPFRGGNIVATFGGCEVDLSETHLADPEVVIEATAMFGGVKIIVPQGWRIVTKGSQFIGGYANKTRPPQSSGAEGSPPRLLVKGFALCGGVEVVHPMHEGTNPR